MLFWIWKKDILKLLKYTNCKWGFAQDCLEVYENGTDHLSNNQRLNEISKLIFFQFYFKIKRNQLEIVLTATYGLHPNKYFEILNLTFWGRSLLTRRFGLHSNSRGADEIKDLPISIDLRNRNTELLLLFSIISQCLDLLECTDQWSCGCRYYAGSFCQVPSFQFLNLSYFTSKDEIPVKPQTLEKMEWYEYGMAPLKYT